MKPTLAAVERGATVALANKECLVCAGSLFMRRAASAGATVLPVDTEHNAVFQALGAGRREDVKRVILTASGGPFRTWTLEAITSGDAGAGAAPSELVDGAEGHHQFRHPDEQGSRTDRGASSVRAARRDEIDVLVHPQSIVHGLVEFRDGSMIAQLGSPDMRIPIAHCLAWPERIDGAGARGSILAEVRELTFEAPDLVRFPALALARARHGSGRGGADRAECRQ